MKKENTKKFYDRIFSWDYLIKYGYYDFIENYNKEINVDTDINIMYGKVNVIDPEFFNMDQLVKVNRKIKQNIASFEDVNTKPIKFFIPKNSSTRRVLKYPNLFSYCKLVDKIVKSKEQEISILCKDKNSLSRFFNISPYTYNSTIQMRDQKLIGFTRFYKTDFSNFYPSFYTHAIPWLIEDKVFAKTHKRNMHYLGNRLDRLLQMSQDGETNGVPTGNIITRIIMELCMAKFDSRLRLALGNEVNFARYVDDIYFGFNNDKELLKIKTTINELASQYNLTLNNSKCSSITYLEIDNSSKLIDYFDNRQINFSNEEKIAKQLNNFYLVARDEILSGVKGTDKLIFTSLRYFIENLEKENIEIFLKGLIYSSENGKGFIDKLMQLVILDSRLIVYFIQLLNIIFEKEREINVATVTNYLKKKITEKYFFHILKANLKENFLNYKNQESYSTLLILSKLQVLLPLDYVMNILEQISKEKIEEYDDFSLILLISNVLSNPLNNKNFLFDRLINCLNQIVSNDYLDKVMALKSFDGKYFSYNHWLLKYYLFYNYKTNLNFKLKIKKFYKNAGTKFGKQYMNFEAFSKLTSNRSTSSKKLKSIDTFYLKLLENNINLSFVPKVYKSNNIL